MVNPDDARKLFEEIVQPKIHIIPSTGLVEYPLDALSEFCEKVGDVDYRFYYYLASEESYSDRYCFRLGINYDTDITVGVSQAFFCYGPEGEAEPISGGTMFQRTLLQCFLDRILPISNEISVDKDGNLYLCGIYSDSIIVEYRIELSETSMGISLYELDGDKSYRFRRVKDTFYCAPTKMFFFRNDDFP